MTAATISSDGQIAIPEAVRERLNLTLGTEIAIEVLGEILMLKQVVSNYPGWRTMRVMAPGGESLTNAWMEKRAAEPAHDNARIDKGR